MDSGNNHSQNTPVRTDYERQIAPITTFIWVQPGSGLMGASEGPGLRHRDSKQTSASVDKYSIRAWDLIICKKCLCFLFCKGDGDKKAKYCDFVPFFFKKK